MNRRSFFSRLTAGVAGAWAATRLPRTPGLTNGSVVPDSSMIYPLGIERTERVEQYFAVTEPFVGIAMKSGKPGDVVEVMIANLPGCKSVSKIQTTTPVVMGDLLIAGSDGTVRAYEPPRPVTLDFKLDGRKVAEAVVDQLNRHKI